jgi:putative two-component system response regulator
MHPMVDAEQDLQQLPIVIVDDEDANVLLLRRILERAGYCNLTTTTDPTDVPGLAAELRPSLLLLDLHMPRIDGFELMEQLNESQERDGVAMLVLTADITDDAKLRALELGARDFLTKPIDRLELVLRVRNLLQVQHLQDRLVGHNARLEDEVAARTWELERARLEVLDRLALAAEYRDDNTQEHARRIGRSSSLIAAELGLGGDQVELIARAAPLHDLGKVGISDAILLKPEHLSVEEFERVKRHTTIGAEILAGGSSALMQMAEVIAVSHHERWDGSGYPAGLAGERIPLPGRIVAVADVFDALTHERPYKSAWRIDAALAEIERGAGAHFDPAVVGAFMRLDHQMLMGAMHPEEPAAAEPAPIHALLLAESSGVA